MNTDTASARVSGSSADEPRTPIAVREILSEVRDVVEEAQAIIAKGFPGGEEMLDGVSNSLNKATLRLLEKSHEYEAMKAQLEEQERQRNAAANPLGEIPAVLDPADTPAYLALIAQHLRQVQLRLERTEFQQGAILQKLVDMDVINQDFTMNTAQRLTEDRDAARQDIMDAILEAHANRSPSPPPSTLLNGPRKLRKRVGDDNIRATSASHLRKPSWQGSMGTVRTFTQRSLSKGKEYLESSKKSAHRRSASEVVLPLERTSFQHGAGTRLHSIDERHAINTLAADELARS
ncbi:hypothetical protein KCU78_g520, partial [Aureobasidium melanogenum]